MGLNQRRDVYDSAGLSIAFAFEKDSYILHPDNASVKTGLSRFRIALLISSVNIRGSGPATSPPHDEVNSLHCFKITICPWNLHALTSARF